MLTYTSRRRIAPPEENQRRREKGEGKKEQGRIKQSICSFLLSNPHLELQSVL
jgi:hypothetical protein